MFREYINMKKNEWKVKSAFYGLIAEVMENQEDVLAFAQKLYNSFKDMSDEDFRKMVVGKLTEIIHAENKDKE